MPEFGDRTPDVGILDRGERSQQLLRARTSGNAGGDDFGGGQSAFGRLVHVSIVRGLYDAWRDRTGNGVERRRLSRQELAVWRSFLRSHATIMRALESELAASKQLSLACYDVLVQLTEAADHRLRMTELADLVLLSRSGLTRLVDRLERDGLVVREPYPGDARGMYAVITDLGLDRLRSATSVHLPGIVEHFVARFSPEELQQLGALLGRISD